MTKAVFLAGSGRCGIKPMRDVLARHSQTAIMEHPPRFLIDPDGIVDFWNTYSVSWSPHIADRRIKRLQEIFWAFNYRHDTRYECWEISKQIPHFREISQRLIDGLVDFQYEAQWAGNDRKEPPIFMFSAYKARDRIKGLMRRFMGEMTESILEANDARLYVDTNTWSILFAKELLELTPDSKLVHIYRDPRDVVASMREQYFFSSDMQQTAAIYRSVMRRWFDIRRFLFPELVMEIRFEELIQSQEQVTQELCEFLNVSFEAGMLPVPPGDPHIGRWKSLLKEERNLLNELLADEIGILGYERGMS